MKNWIEVTRAQYDSMTCTSYSGGSSWFTSPEFPGAALVLHGSTPAEGRRSFFGKGSDYKLTMEVR